MTTTRTALAAASLAGVAVLVGLTYLVVTLPASREQAASQSILSLAYVRAAVADCGVPAAEAAAAYHTLMAEAARAGLTPDELVARIRSGYAMLARRDDAAGTCRRAREIVG